jgi:hypothetical protein
MIKNDSNISSLSEGSFDPNALLIPLVLLICAISVQADVELMSDVLPDSHRLAASIMQGSGMTAASSSGKIAHTRFARYALFGMWSILDFKYKDLPAPTVVISNHRSTFT